MNAVIVNRNNMVVVASLVFLILGVGVGGEAERLPSQPAPDSKLVLRVLGPDRRPLPGAKVGTGVNMFEDSQGNPPQTITMWLRGRMRSWPYVSDEYGEVLLTGEEAEYNDFYALYDARGWVGHLRMREGMSGGRADIVLEPACRVYGQIKSSGLLSLGRSPYKTTAFLYDSKDTMLMYFVSERGYYEFLLPSGSYRLEFVAEGPGGVESQRVRREFTIDRARREMNVAAIDLPGTTLAALLGKRAPELLGVVGWRKGESVQLADLKGRVVVLAFWATWSQASLKTMPRLIELHDLYQDEGLAIVAVHDNSVGSAEQLKAGLDDAQLRYWGRRDLPFAIGLDSGEGRGSVHEIYGITEWPTTIVIDRQGKIAGLFHPWGELQRELPGILEQTDSATMYSSNSVSGAPR